jgi:hypothetical protein
VIGAAFAGFVDRGVYPSWVLAVIALMFAQLVAALGTVGAEAAASATVPGLLLAVTIASLASRMAWLARRRNGRVHAARER